MSGPSRGLPSSGDSGPCARDTRGVNKRSCLYVVSSPAQRIRTIVITRNVLRAGGLRIIACIPRVSSTRRRVSRRYKSDIKYSHGEYAAMTRFPSLASIIAVRPYAATSRVTQYRNIHCTTLNSNERFIGIRVARVCVPLRDRVYPDGRRDFSQFPRSQP